MAVFRKTYRRGHVELWCFGCRIFSFNRDSKFFARLRASRKNAELSARNREIIEAWSNPEKAVEHVLFVVRSLEATGGMETRLDKFASELKRRGMEPCFLVMYHEYEPLKKYPTFRLNMNAPDFQQTLEALVSAAGISVVEFQVKWESFLETFDWEHLRSVCRAGCTVHEASELPWDIVDRMDYSIFVREKNMDKVRNGHLVLNGVEKAELVWQYAGQKKAVFISRLNGEKLPTLIAFCEFCRKNGLHGDIASPLTREAVNIRERILRQYGKDQYTFLGAVETESFLKEHGKEYLFCAGVGQVVLEGAAFGMPTLICAHAGVEYSTFLCEENFSLLRRNNFVIASSEDIPTRQELSFAREWKTSEFLLREISFRTQFEKWLNVVFPGERS